MTGIFGRVIAHDTRSFNIIVESELNLFYLRAVILIKSGSEGNEFGIIIRVNPNFYILICGFSSADYLKIWIIRGIKEGINKFNIYYEFNNPGFMVNIWSLLIISGALEERRREDNFHVIIGIMIYIRVKGDLELFLKYKQYILFAFIIFRNRYFQSFWYYRGGINIREYFIIGGMAEDNLGLAVIAADGWEYIWGFWILARRARAWEFIIRREIYIKSSPIKIKQHKGCG